jgi:hypothetical protein
VADVQRAGRIGGDELDHHRRRRIGRLQAERRRALQDLGDDALPRRGAQVQVDEAGAGDVDRFDPALERALLLERGDQLGRDLARIAPLRLGERHRRGAGEVAVGRLARPFERGDEGIARAHFVHRCAQRIEQFVTGPGHRRILRGGFCGSCRAARSRWRP